MANMADTPEEEPKKGRSNAILTYETVELLNLGIQRVDLKLDGVTESIKAIKEVHVDHEVRLRAVEMVQARQGGAFSTWGIAFLSIWPVAGFLMALLAYLNKT